jgi:hypothetical protein
VTITYFNESITGLFLISDQTQLQIQWLLPGLLFPLLTLLRQLEEHGRVER